MRLKKDFYDARFFSKGVPASRGAEARPTKPASTTSVII